MEFDDQYGIADLRQYMTGRTHFPAVTQLGDFFSGHRNLITQAQHPYEMVMVGRQCHQVSAAEMVPRGGLLHHEFRSDYSTTSTTAASVAAASSTSLNGLEMEGGGGVGGDGGTVRWPRQETLSLLEIRSRLDSKFKEANQKGPLWDEVARKMSEEHGYQRSGKKCREKFENLYKYYKKTKDGKAGRQDGKHYRFFRQLEALYGDTSTAHIPVSVSETQHIGKNFPIFPNSSDTKQEYYHECFQDPKLCDSLSLSNSESDTSSSDDNDINVGGYGLMDNDSEDKKKKKKKKMMMRRRRRSWKAKITDFIDSQMRKLVEKQDEWLEKMMKTLERKDQERVLREEEWRKKESARIERDHKVWANEKAWIGARDAALMEALQKLTGKESKASSSPDDLTGCELQSQSENHNENGSETITTTWKGDQSWAEAGEFTKVIQLRTSMESRFQNGISEEVLGWY